MRPDKKELTEEEKFELQLQCEQELGRLARTVNFQYCTYVLIFNEKCDPYNKHKNMHFSVLRILALP